MGLRVQDHRMKPKWLNQVMVLKRQDFEHTQEHMKQVRR